MRSAPPASPTYFYDAAAGSIMERTLDGTHPITKDRARLLQARFRTQGVALLTTCPEVSDFVRGMFVDVFNALAGLREAERGNHQEAA